MRLSQRFDLPISQKGLVLVLVPVAFGVIFTISLAVLLKQAQSDVWKEADARLTVSAVNAIGRHFITAAQHLFRYSITDRLEVLDEFSEEIEQTITNVETIRELAIDKPKQLEQVGNLATLTNDGLYMLEDFARYIEQKDRLSLPSKGFSYQREITKLLDRLTDVSRSVVQEEEGERDKGVFAASKTREAAVGWLSIGVVVNVILAFLMALFFTRSITRRLSTLVENSQRLAARQELLPALRGTDEIAVLDHTFHDMAESLAEVEKLKEEFLQMVSHDLRTPLTSIQFSLSIILENSSGKLADSDVEELEAAERNCNHLITLINRLLDVEKIESGKMDLDLAQMSVAGLIKRAADAVNPFAMRHGVTLVFGNTDVSIVADEDRLLQVLVNLISNAIKFSPSGGKVTLKIEQSPGWLEFAVVDQGPGIPEDYKATIFDRFQQVKMSKNKRKGGTGLGLAICRAIVLAHSGEIGVRGKEGEGSTFWFRIPI